MSFAAGEKTSELVATGTVGRRNTGTTIQFLPDPGYFDSPRFAVGRLRHVLRAKAVLCPGLTVSLLDENTGESDEWSYEGGVQAYLRDALQGSETLPSEPFTVSNFTQVLRSQLPVGLSRTCRMAPFRTA